MEVLAFIASIAKELVAIFEYAKAGQSDPEVEHQLALSLIRKAKDAQANAMIPAP